MTKLQRKIFEANMALQYFTMNHWAFLNNNFVTLCDKLKLEDLRDFDYRDCFNFDIIHYMTICLVGTKKYLLYDKEENEKFTRAKYQFLKTLGSILSSIPYIILFYYAFIKYDSIQTIKGFLNIRD